ncbi:hypothetical protein SteCoe_30213 [Stentor coeruleus]|uniref:MPN domain-containing protein n=1 Tax=Stentor coeruleus TaxID=5963 RepID=A0A1R2B419_9CILI|nr:hypothetical protein SteCoe_30213 [Stentor coeruleus]
MSLDFLSMKTLHKAVLHCANHSGQDVIGAISATDCFPLFHSHVTTPIAEAALNLLRDENIIGFYESRIKVNKSGLEPSRLILNLASALRARGVGQVFVLVIDSDWDNNSPLWLYTLTPTSYSKIHEYPQTVIASVRDLVQDKKDIFDFDDHFANINADWKNSHIS